MTDAEQIEARKEFESGFTEGSFDMHEDGSYKNQKLEWMWIGYLLCKQRQPVIELPRILSMSMMIDSKEMTKNEAVRMLYKLCDEYGIKYKVKE